MPARPPKLPQCRDTHDQMFVELAAVGKADFPVTGDKDLLALAPIFGQRIVTADAFLDRLDASCTACRVPGRHGVAHPRPRPQAGNASTPSTASHTGTLTAHSIVDTVTSPATNGPWPPMRTAST